MLPKSLQEATLLAQPLGHVVVSRVESVTVLTRVRLTLSAGDNSVLGTLDESNLGILATSGKVELLSVQVLVVAGVAHVEQRHGNTANVAERGSLARVPDNTLEAVDLVFEVVGDADGQSGKVALDGGLDGAALEVVGKALEVSGHTNGGNNLRGDRSVAVQKGPGVGGVVDPAGVLGEELVVEADVHGVDDVEGLVVAEDAAAVVDGSQAGLGVLQDTVVASNDTLLEGLLEGLGVVGTGLGEAVDGVVEVQRLVNLGTRVLIDNGGIETQKRHGGKSVVGVNENKAIGGRQVGHSIRAGVDTFGAIAGLDTILGNVLVGGHHGATTTVPEDDDLVNFSQVAQVAHALADVGHHILKVDVGHIAALAGIVVGAEGRKAAAGELVAG